MILEQLTITDFRVFQGRHTLDLSPRTKYGQKRPIILFGGLNGAGKTTILTAIRHVLYGKQALGAGVSKKAYDAFLGASIHRAKDVLVQPFSASIELTFSYANMGVIKHYSVKREWMLENKKTVEHLSIAEDGKTLTELNADQCQGFLNELIPIGVSDLFFFDGEKIAELAEDAAGMALGDSIKKLLGLDMVDTLHTDLTLLLRNKSKKNASTEIQQQISTLEQQLEEIEQTSQEEQECFQQAKPVEKEAQYNIEKLENTLSSKGGAWAASRENEIKRKTVLETEQKLLENQLREYLSDSFPIAIAEQSAHNILTQLRAEKNYKALANTSKLVKNHLHSLEKNLRQLLSKHDYEDAHQLIETEFKQLLHVEEAGNLIHDVSDSMLNTLEAIVIEATVNQKKKVKQLCKQLIETKQALDDVSKNIARAPDNDQIMPILQEINKEQERKQQSIKAQVYHLERHKSALRDAITLVRQLDKLSEALKSESEKDKTMHLIARSKGLLSDFSRDIANKKVKDLEAELIKSFERLSRKEDMHLKVEIDPKTFSVKLTGDQGRLIDKNELSAGEKQIYAISILEALAKTSGRNLPIIIDTPLGRLDSHHRNNLINNYLPYASHQVIVLSTDTEVDEAFYTTLSSKISHAYQLDYTAKQGSTIAREGYFWKTSQQGTR